MSTYLLLRDNKQSGPYTLDEIKAKGFKKYDLVWVEKKSAAWRYPGEVEELKSFAPVIEEQPFDRFFKKPVEEKQSANISQASFSKAEVVKSAVLPQVVVEIGNKKVYAVLPAKKAATVQSKETFSYQQSNKQPIKEGEPKPIANDNFLAEKKSNVQPQQSFKQNAGRSISTKNINPYQRFIQPAALVACVLALLGAGIFIGLSINKGNSNQATKTNATDTQVASVNKHDAQNLLIPVPSEMPKQDKPAALNEEKTGTNNNQIKNDNTALQTNTAELTKKTSAIIEKKKTTAPKQNSILPDSKTISKQESKTDSNSSYVSVPHREATHRTDAINDKEFVKNNIANLISVSANKYHVGTFGGISEVQLTVSNKSLYPLDLVMVEVQYVQANKKVFKTENIYFHNVRAGESVMLEAPESARGIKVQYRIALVNSKDPAISYSGT